MDKVCNCKVVTFGSKPTGFVLEVNYNEKNKPFFVIKQNIQNEVEEHFEYDEKELIRLDEKETKGINLEELVKLAKEKLSEKVGKNEELFVHAMVVHVMCTWDESRERFLSAFLYKK